jgi:hypothetical protein
MAGFARINRMTSGGQAGADRAALDAAREFGIAVGGWCPRGGRAEDLPDPPGLLVSYPELRETPSPIPAERTVWNVRDAHATVVIWPGRRTGSPGTRLTVAAAVSFGRPVLVTTGTDAEELADFLDPLGRGLTVNVAGPRESEVPGIYALTRGLLDDYLRRPG